MILEPKFSINNQSRLSCPGKVFLLGEYSILHGSPAMIATVGPRFRLLGQALGSTNLQTTFPEGCPADLLLRSMNRADTHFRWLDPLNGAGGLGASSAQFLLLAYAHHQELGITPNWKSVWQLFKKLNPQPSGADIVAQILGDITIFDPQKVEATSHLPPRIAHSILLFSTTLGDFSHRDRKVKTHEHLADYEKHPLSSAKLNELNQATLDGINALKSDSCEGLAQAINKTADLLSSAHLSLPATDADREALMGLPGVLAIKGAGALQADAIVILLEPESHYRNTVIEVAQSRNLTLLANGLPHEAGIVVSTP